MNTKLLFAAIVVVLAATADAQPKFCQPVCGGGNQRANPNAFISSCCMEREVTIGDNFDACCASSCNTNSPCKWDDISTSASPAP
ncbi:hypothetical protein P3T76_013817 [Phytophthora citrophthora]|uniref:Phytotoxin PcF domain-containing protein n=1 Tax=Phytophthora citrophthora TaxID=4793 RepID=A0AAD9LC12_9STRA|nr:hypothetical protein P3T76_013817 [Phytophthora citrophthora]